MSSRGWLTTNPGKKAEKLLSESSSCIPLLWLGFLTVEDFEGQSDAVFELDRKSAIQQAEHNIDFLAAAFPDIPKLIEISRAFLSRLRRLRCKTIGMDLTELADLSDPVEPALRTVVDTIASQNESFTLIRPAKTINGIRRKALNIECSRDLLLEIAWLTPSHISMAAEQDLPYYVVGSLWEKHLPKAEQ